MNTIEFLEPEKSSPSQALSQKTIVIGALCLLAVLTRYEIEQHLFENDNQEGRGQFLFQATLINNWLVKENLFDEGLIDTVKENDLPAHGKAFENLTHAELLGKSLRSEQRLKSLQWISCGCEIDECNSLRDLELHPSHSFFYALQ